MLRRTGVMVALAIVVFAPGNNILMSRVALIEHARHSIDLQYCIFDNDATGRLVAQRLLAATDRGVCVRLPLARS